MPRFCLLLDLASLCSWKDADHAHGLGAECRQGVNEVARKSEARLAQIDCEGFRAIGHDVEGPACRR
jgi:hypothetical protein